MEDFIEKMDKLIEQNAKGEITAEEFLKEFKIDNSNDFGKRFRLGLVIFDIIFNKDYLASLFNMDPDNFNEEFKVIENAKEAADVPKKYISSLKRIISDMGAAYLEYDCTGREIWYDLRDRLNEAYPTNIGQKLRVIKYLLEWKKEDVAMLFNVDVDSVDELYKAKETEDWSIEQLEAINGFTTDPITVECVNRDYNSLLSRLIMQLRWDTDIALFFKKQVKDKEKMIN